jgi:hypothetical protein
MRPADKYAAQDLIRVQSDPAILYASLELSQSSWLVTSLSPGSEKISKYATSAGDAAALLVLLARLQNRAMRSLDRSLRIVVIQEAGLDGFWVHRLLERAIAGEFRPRTMFRKGLSRAYDGFSRPDSLDDFANCVGHKLWLFNVNMMARPRVCHVPRAELLRQPVVSLDKLRPA